MDLWLEHVIEPTKLTLAWEAPKAYADRKRWAVGELVAGDETATFRYFQGDEFSRFNCDRNLQDLKAAGYRGYPTFQQFESSGTFSEKVLEAFLRRLPPADRSDFAKYLQHFRLPPESKLSPMSLLAVTGAKLPGDGFELIDTLLDTTGPFDLVMQVAGYRHNYQNAPDLSAGDALDIVAEPHNPHDSSAIAVQSTGRVIGHVNRLQAVAFGRLLQETEVTAHLLRLNGTTDVPKAFAFVRVRPGIVQRAA